MNGAYLELALAGALVRNDAVRAVRVGPEAFYTPAGVIVTVTVQVRPEAHVDALARVHALIVRKCYDQGALPSVVMIPSSSEF